MSAPRGPGNRPAAEPRGLEAAPAPTRGARRHAPIIALGVVIAFLAGGLAWRTVDQRAQLLRTEIDDIADRPDLMKLGDDRGRRVFAQACASCHGDEGRGERGRGAPDLTDHDWLYGSGSAGDTERIVAYGIRSHNPKGWNLSDMPAFARPKPSATYPVGPLTPGQLNDVTEFVVYLGGRPAEPAAVARGGQVFANSGACFDCHAGDGAGDAAIGAPNLTDGVWLYGDGSRSAISRSIALGRAGVMPGFQGRLSPFDLRAVSLYAYRLSHERRHQATKVR